MCKVEIVEKEIFLKVEHSRHLHLESYGTTLVPIWKSLMKQERESINKRY